MKTKRLFIGIPLEVEAANRLEILQLNWKESLALPKSSLVSKSDFHLTLHFLGNVKEEEVDKWLEALQEHAKQKSFSFILNQFLAFPGNASARVITLSGASGNSPLSYLYHQVGETVERLGCRVEKRLYIPHITLFRGKEFKITNPIQDFSPLEIKINQFALYESKLVSEENRYQILKPYLFTVA